MTILKCKMKNVRGLTLIEMAIILVILGLLIGTTLPLLSGLTRQRHVRSTQKELEEIKEALTGYAGIHWRLPSADTDGDGQGDGTDSAGTLPYVDLGLGSQDAWRNMFTYDVNFSLTTTPDKSGFCAALASLGGSPEIPVGTSQAAVRGQQRRKQYFGRGKWGHEWSICCRHAYRIIRRFGYLPQSKHPLFQTWMSLIESQTGTKTECLIVNS